MQRALRALLALLLPRPRLFGLALRLGALAKPFGALLPASLRGLLAVIPSGLRTDILAPQVFPVEGPRQRRVALLAGCAQQALDGAINAATIRLLRRHGCEVVVAQGAGCCGSLNLHMGHEATAMQQARANVVAWSREIDGQGIDAVVINASGCGISVKDYGHLLARDPMAAPAALIGALTRDVTELMQEIGMLPAQGPGAYRVAYHDPCSMQHGQKVIREPRALLAAAGFRVVDVPEKHFCCGSAGTYNLLQPEMAEALGQRKAAHIASTDPDIIATGNIGCMMQLRRYSHIPIVHTVELLDWATGGPMPPALYRVTLRTPEPIAVSTPEAPIAPTGDAGFW
jgi:glycolate oxidase iron-sulfur subunit